MICIKCFNKSTNVTNSRPQRKQHTVWRRRQCVQCKAIFTTIERPSLADNTLIMNTHNEEETFNLGKLIISIAGAFTHQPEKAAYEAMWLAQTVEEILSREYKVITADDIAAVTHQALKRFDELAAVQYAARHRLITSVKRRGRPSISPLERGPRTGASPSR